MTSLEGKVVAITGAASGIGLATAHLLASRGASISVADVRQKPLDAAVAAIKDSSLNVKIFAKGVDVLNGQAVDDWLDETIKELGPLVRIFWFHTLPLHYTISLKARLYDYSPSDILQDWIYPLQ